MRETHRDLPVVFVTAFALERLVHDAIAEGAFTVLRKPVDVAQLLRVVARALEAPQILIVDDDAAHRESLAAAIRTEGRRVLTAGDGRAALAALAAERVDVALVDLVMPGSDGTATIEALRSAQPGIETIAITGHDVPNLVRRASQIGCRAILRKPLDVRELLRVVCDARGSPR
jgi:CheY-like chemotaxis protein